MVTKTRTVRCGALDARVRLRTAVAYLEVAELVLDERRHDEYISVAAGLAVLAGIAAADSICCTRLGRLHRGEDHRGAASLLTEAVPDGKALASRLLRLLDVKDEAHYGVIGVAPRKGRDAIKWARQLVERARDEVER